MRHTGHGLQVPLVDALGAEGVFKDGVRFRKGFVHIAPLAIQDSTDVAPHAGRIALVGWQVWVHERSLGLQCGDGISDGRQILIVHLDEGERLQRRDFVHRGHCGQRFTNVAHLVQGKYSAVFHRPSTETHIGDVFAGDDGPDTGQLLSFGSINAQDAGMRSCGLQYFAHQHPRQVDIAGVLGTPRDLVGGIHPRVTFT